MDIGKKHIREKLHRLPRESYRGEVAVVFTACVANNQPLFKDQKVCHVFELFLREAAEKNACTVPIYCFMPDHVHLLLQGMSSSADTWKAMVDFKQTSGFWLRQNRLMFRWQKDFYDHIIRYNEDLGAQVRYIAGNPVRKGLVQDWEEYPYTGAIGIDLKAVMESASTL